MDSIGRGVAPAGDAATVELIAGTLCLNFANTLEPRVSRNNENQPREYLTAYAALLVWSRHVGTLTTDHAALLSIRAARRPAAAAAMLEEALGLREAIYSVFYSIAGHHQAAPKDLATISAAYAAAMENALLAPQGKRFDIAWAGDPEDLARPLWPIARSALELLLEGDPARIKDCPTGGAGCGRLFYDTSKNNSRRWCSMRGCGGPEKERRRAERRRTG